jgi:membrane-associated protease RseP (regulator of RpoE activity)
VAIPGISPIIPLGWGVLAFVICLVIHEFGHGIQARAHGMRVRNFGLLMLGPLPMGAFAEPEYSEISNSPRRERQRMFAAGPATNIFAALILMIILGQVAGQFESADSGVHSSKVIVESGAAEAGLEPWDVIIAINGSEIDDTQDFVNVMDGLTAGQTVPMEIIRYNNGSQETIEVNLTDKYAYYIDLGWNVESLESMGIEEGDAFLGVQSLAGGTAGVDRLAGWTHPDFETSAIGYAISVPSDTLNILITPFENQGVAIHPAQEDMLDAGDGWLSSLIGLSGLLFLVNLLFWLIWVNILLGFTNLFPMIPFDGGHLFKDMVHGIMSGIRNVGKKTGLYKLHPLWVEHVTRKASSLSSILLLLVMVFLIGAPYL